MKKYLKIINIISLLILSFFLLIYIIAYAMKDRANNESAREVCQQVYEGPKNIINLISLKFWGKETFGRTIDKALKIQNKIEKQIKKEYSELEYTWRQPYIKINPYGSTPLSALIKFKTDEPMKVKIEIVDREGSNIVYEFNDYITEHEYTISGLYLKGETEIYIYVENKLEKQNKKKIKIKSEYNLGVKDNYIVLTNKLLNTNLY